MSKVRYSATIIFPAGVFYIALVAGGVLPIAEDGFVHNLVRAFVLFGVIASVYMVGISARAINFIVSFVLALSLLTLPSLVRSQDPSYAIAKLESLILGTAIAVLVCVGTIKKVGWPRFREALVYFGLLILILTVFYKFLFGFFDRSVRFFLNGPIVFGWMMGLMVILSSDSFFEDKKKRYVIFSALFMGGMIWSQSKGPLLSLVCVYPFIMHRHYAEGRFGKKAAVLSLVLVVAAAAIAYDALRDSSSRLGVFSSGNALEAEENYGSLGVRFEMLRDGLALAQDNFLWGIGVGNWQSETGYIFKYPHNQHLEVLVEFGSINFLIYVVSVGLMMALSAKNYRYVALYFMVAGSFSGDVSYLRYMMTFLLAGVIVRGSEIETGIRARHYS